MLSPWTVRRSRSDVVARPRMKESSLCRASIWPGEQLVHELVESGGAQRVDEQG